MNTTIRRPRGRTVESYDGTSLHAYGYEGDPPPLLIVNAIGAGLAAWRGVISEVVQQVVTWDHRGLYRSDPAADGRMDAAAHAADAVEVLDGFGIEETTVVAWSTGAPIALELAASAPDRVSRVVIACGGYGHGMARLARLELASLLPFGAALGKRFASYLEIPFRRFVSRAEIAGVIRQSGVIGPTADIDALVELLRGLASCDLKTLLATYDAVVGETRRDLLGSVRQPTLLVAGERDTFTPRRMVEEMAVEMPDAQLVVYDRASHYLPLEFPTRFARDIVDFASARGH